ncbi:DUF4254 domain-containing protein [Nocardia puris]|uniref:Uncharacterized protein DUF4254 n=1 Tax=Nocardia puris TaxID=208602 RepID=A0A366CZ47_9NOCA|nr:DUF4254 domain-containing protein [Nocardia puris]MBF6211889.1 DUF4254 domain-containing protein [Nocardia puris]MBF6366916.1 DUF4254 domain-containing protein [Nocardia puris]RBO82509.1 uncharacterized protein DUF4254 [Nocardia puris]
MPTEYAVSRVRADELPPSSALLRAFRDRDGRGHPVLDTARELAACHERRRALTAGAGDPQRTALEDIDGHRAELVDRINGWVATHVVHRTGASLHTETLGAVIDRMAAKWIAARQALGFTDATDRPPAGLDGQARLQWTRLAELADGYQDLITDVAEHRRRLPVW